MLRAALSAALIAAAMHHAEAFSALGSGACSGVAVRSALCVATPSQRPSSLARQRPPSLVMSLSEQQQPAAESRLMALVSATKSRGQKASTEQLQGILESISELEAAGGVTDPARSPIIQGSWELLYTSKSQFDFRNPLGARVDGSKPGIEGFFEAVFGKGSKMADGLSELSSSSPIQRSVTSIDGVQVLQDVILDGPDPRVDQKVVINDSVYLRLSASASLPPDNFRRINFTFDLAYFQLGPLRVPYPVPFRLLGDEAKGWLETTYLSPSLRISRGNKGTTFILRRRD